MHQVRGKAKHAQPQPAPIAHLTARQVIWGAIRSYREQSFTYQGIVCSSQASKHIIQDYLSELCEAGIVEISRAPNLKARIPALYRLVRDCGAELPKLKCHATGQARMWAAFKIVRQFTADDIVAAAGVKRSAALAYLLALKHAGYLATLRSHTPTRLTTFRLNSAMDTGPLPPAIRRGKHVFDLNTGKEMKRTITLKVKCADCRV